MSVNKVILVGRLGADPELKTLSSGQSVANFNIATSENWVDRDGQKQERTEWHRIVVWAKLAEVCRQHLSKGRQVYVEGIANSQLGRSTRTKTLYDGSCSYHCSVSWCSF